MNQPDTFLQPFIRSFSKDICREKW